MSQYTPHIKKKCPTCGKRFLAKMKSRIYCSNACWAKRYYVDNAPDRKCKNCDKQITVGRSDTKYCNAECYHEYVRKTGGSKKGKFKDPPRACQTCGKIYQGASRGSKFCSPECYYEHNRAYGPPFKGHKHTKESRQKIAEAVARSAHRISAGQSKYWQSMEPETRHKEWKRRVYSKPNRRFFTPIEQMIAAILVEKNIKFEQNIPIAGYIPDIVIPSKKIIIECDGEGWHNKPEIIAHDKKRDKVLQSLGYTIIRLRGKDINKDPKHALAEGLRKHFKSKTA